MPRLLLLAILALLPACASTGLSDYTTPTGITRVKFESSLPSGYTRTVTSFGGKVIGTKYQVVQIEHYTLPGGTITEIGYFITPDPSVSAHLASGDPIPPRPTDEVLGK